jgi:hypothetical protein
MDTQASEVILTQANFSTEAILAAVLLGVSHNTLRTALAIRLGHSDSAAFLKQGMKKRKVFQQAGV